MPNAAPSVRFRIQEDLAALAVTVWTRMLGRPVKLREAVERSIEYTAEKERSDG